MTIINDYTIACWRGGWIVYKGTERRWPVATGFSSRERAEKWITFMNNSTEEDNA